MCSGARHAFYLCASWQPHRKVVSSCFIISISTEYLSFSRISRVICVEVFVKVQRFVVCYFVGCCYLVVSVDSPPFGAITRLFIIVRVTRCNNLSRVSSSGRASSPMVQLLRLFREGRK